MNANVKDALWDSFNAMDLSSFKHKCIYKSPCTTGRIQFKILTTLPLKLERVSRPTVEKFLRSQFGEDINSITFGKFVALLVHQLKKKCVHKNCAIKYWLPISLFTCFLKFWTQWCYRIFRRLPEQYLHQTVILDFQLLSLETVQIARSYQDW